MIWGLFWFVVGSAPLGAWRPDPLNYEETPDLILSIRDMYVITRSYIASPRIAQQLETNIAPHAKQKNKKQGNQFGENKTGTIILAFCFSWLTTVIFFFFFPYVLHRIHTYAEAIGGVR